jgi:glycosyltransferase involved in cell wall biosynthesis
MIIDFILAGTAVQKMPFDPMDLCGSSRGITGTDLQVFGLAKEMCKRGHNARVFSEFKHDDKTIEQNTDEKSGVTYYQLWKAHTLPPSDVAIAYHDGVEISRWPTRFRMVLHQTCTLPVPIEMEKADLFLSATEVNKDLLSNTYPGTKWDVIPNGWDFGQYQEWNPVAGRMIFHTSPERGLVPLLEALPHIRKNWRSSLQLKIFGRIEQLKLYGLWPRFEAAMKVAHEYVTIDRPKSRNEILKEISRASLLAYPSEPPNPCEVWPISVMECLATGVPVLLAPADGIEKVFGNAVKLTAPNISRDPRAFQDFVDLADNMLDLGSSMSETYSENGKAFAQKNTFKHAADKLEEIIERETKTHVSVPVTHTADRSLALCMIVKDVAPYISEALASVLPYIDELSIVDTGSSDDTSAVIQQIVNYRRSLDPGFIFHWAAFNQTTDPEHFFIDEAETFKNAPIKPPENYPTGEKIHTGEVMLGHFGAARQRSFDNATSRFKMWIDSDDVVVGAAAIPDAINNMISRGIDSLILNYEYDHDENGNVTLQNLRERIVDTKSDTGKELKWELPIHENFAIRGNIRAYPEKYIKIVHRISKIKDKIKRVPLRNYKVLCWQMNKMVRTEQEIHPRMWYSLAQESSPWNKDLGRRFYEKYVEVATYAEEKGLAHLQLGRIAETDGRINDAVAHYATSSVIFPKPEAFFGLARLAYHREDMEECIRQHEKGRIAILTTKDLLHSKPVDRFHFPAIWASRAYLRLGNLTRAERLVKEGLAIAPRDIQLRAISDVITRKIARKKKSLSIIFHTSKSLERWNAKTPLTTGIGGSETAVVMISQQLAKRGHQVTVYCDCEGINGTFDNVQYVPFDRFEPKTSSSDVFITSRRAGTLVEHDIQAKLKILWMHDNHAGTPTFDMSKALLAPDKIFCVSQWHKQYVSQVYPFIDPRRIVATRNGIDTDFFSPGSDLGSKQQKLIYSSSSDRGLELALDLFARVRQEVPEAELHVFYGFNTIDRMLESPQLQESQKQFYRDEKKKLIEKIEMSPGVIAHGRVSQPVLARHFMEAKVLFFPTHFEESSCITAMEAQAAGCIPVTTALAALKETVHHGYLIPPPALDNHPSLKAAIGASQDYQDKIVKYTVMMLKDDAERGVLAHEARKETMENSSWSNVAHEWEDYFFDNT